MTTQTLECGTVQVNAARDSAPGGNAEPIPGYVLKERIGHGGYGEVWRAEAPGGLQKAVKIIYGTLDGSRAEREMKSLQRMKELRHPFLLMLERIEVVDGRLMIVTELADGSLRDRFREYREAGREGLPRDELLAYLRDAAEVLDFMYEEYGLQHLDIKPDNLLLVGKHIKVADFGLIKDLRDTSVSMMGGMTPLFCAPEVFEGRPTRYSDQYSLAIVYQIMLTGEPPFGGRTAAQLTSQHLHSPPTLAPLPPWDRSTIARALSKTPTQRFSDCREMIARLIERGQREHKTVRKVVDATGSRPPERPIRRGDTEELSQTPARAEAMTSLPPLSITEADVKHRPAVFVGLGGLAGRTLCRLRRRLRRRFGPKSLPALQFLYIDTDRSDVAEAVYGDEESSLEHAAALEIPLRTPQEYRAHAGPLLEWISRRWLFNIPRSMETEGIRPLGRLALVDHFEKVRERLDAAISTAVSTDAIKTTARNTSLSFDHAPPLVYLIAAVNGGTGSGTVLDLAYAVRTVLAGLDLSDEGVCGMLLHGTPRVAGARDIALANSLACLEELQHFSRFRGGYPGERACGIPQFLDDNQAFRHAWFVHLGDELGERDFDAAADDIAEYLFRNTLTRSSAYFSVARTQSAAESVESSRQFEMKTLAVSVLESSLNTTLRRRAASVCRALIERWSGVRAEGSAVNSHEAAGSRQTTDNGQRTTDQPQLSAEDSELSTQFRSPAVREVEDALERLELTGEAAARRAESIIDGEAGRQVEAIVRRSLPAADGDAVAPERARVFFERIDTDLASDEEESGASLKAVLGVVQRQLESSATETASALRWEILQLLNDPELRLHGAVHAAECARKSIRRISAGLATRADSIGRELANICSLAEPPAEEPSGRRKRRDSGPEAVALEKVHQYAVLAFQQAVYSDLARHATSIAERISGIDRELQAIRRILDSIGVELREFYTAQLKRSTRQTAEESGWLDIPDLVADEQDAEYTAAVLPLVEQELQADFLDVEKPLADLLTGTDSERDSLVRAIRRAADRVLMKEGLPGTAEAPEGISAASPYECLVETVRETRRRLPATSGGRRLFIAQARADETLAGAVRRRTGDEPTVLADGEPATFLCYEVEGAKLAEIVATLAANRPDLVEMAARLHTRIDVEWN